MNPGSQSTTASPGEQTQVTLCLPETSSGKQQSAQDEPEGKSPVPAPLWLYFINLVLWIGFGVGLSGWCLYYTEYLPQVAGLLGLGGLFAWMAFVLNLISE